MPEAPGPTLTIDPHRVHEAIVNLLINALEACDERPGDGRVALCCEVSEGRVRVVVRDNGRGMDAATRDRVGTAFFTRRPGGTGLGVAHARRVLALLRESASDSPPPAALFLDLPGLIDVELLTLGGFHSAEMSGSRAGADRPRQDRAVGVGAVAGAERDNGRRLASRRGR